MAPNFVMVFVSGLFFASQLNGKLKNSNPPFFRACASYTSEEHALKS